MLPAQVLYGGVPEYLEGRPRAGGGGGVHGGGALAGHHDAEIGGPHPVVCGLPVQPQQDGGGVHQEVAQSVDAAVRDAGELLRQLPKTLQQEKEGWLNDGGFDKDLYELINNVGCKKLQNKPHYLKNLN